MPRSPRQLKVYHLQKCRSYIIKALARMDKIGLVGDEVDARMKVAIYEIQACLTDAYSAANSLLDVMTSKNQESRE